MQILAILEFNSMNFTKSGKCMVSYWKFGRAGMCTSNQEYLKKKSGPGSSNKLCTYIWFGHVRIRTTAATRLNNWWTLNMKYTRWYTVNQSKLLLLSSKSTAHTILYVPGCVSASVCVRMNWDGCYGITAVRVCICKIASSRAERIHIHHWSVFVFVRVLARSMWVQSN